MIPGVSPVSEDTPVDIKPLLFANIACAMPMMAFVAVVAPVARVLGLQPWQAGATVTAAAGSIGAVQGMGMVTGPLIGTLLYAAGPAVPSLLVAALLLVMALWPRHAAPERQ